LQEGIDYYINEEGMLVFTVKAHLDRGYCCGRGCKHCPYDYINVPEIKRARLLEARKSDEEERGQNG
jgi:hypothetical protein